MDAHMKTTVKQSTTLGIINTGTKFVVRIFTVLNYTTTSEGRLIDSTMHHFTSLDVPLLSAFIVVRNLQYSTKSEPQNKNELSNAIDGKHNLTNVVFCSHFLLNHLSALYNALDEHLDLNIHQVILHRPMLYNPPPMLARLPLKFTNNTDWVSAVFAIVDTDEKFLRHTIDQVSLRYADRLITKLADRLE